jgi:preprotein translocase subunit SecE
VAQSRRRGRNVEENEVVDESVDTDALDKADVSEDESDLAEDESTDDPTDLDDTDDADLDEDDVDEVDDGAEVDEDEIEAAESRADRKARKAEEKATKKTGGKDVKVDLEDSGPGIFGRFGRFVLEVVAELRKVIWPSRKDLLVYSTVVIVFVTIMLTIVGTLDWAFARAVLWVFSGN